MAAFSRFRTSAIVPLLQPRASWICCQDDPVRFRPDSRLRERLTPFADAVGWVVNTYQDDDDDGLHIAVAHPDQLYGWLAPLSAEDFVVDAGRPDAPF